MASDLTKAVLRAIDAGASSEEFAAIELPDSYTAVALHAEDAETLGKLPRAEKRPSPAMHVEDVPVPEIAPDEVLIATMASSMNFNTVWSAIFEPVPTFAFLSPLRQGARPLGQAPRPAVPRRRLRRRRRRAAHRLRRVEVEARRPRRRAPERRRARGSAGPRRHDPRPRPARLGLRVQLRRARRGVPREGRPADAEGGAPDVGGGGLDAAHQLHRLPHARRPERRAHAAGRRRADLGRGRRPRRLRDAVRAERRRHAGVRRVEPREGRRLPLDGRRPGDRPQGARLPVLGRGDGPAEPEGGAAPGQDDPPADRRPRRRHRLRAPGARHVRRVACSSRGAAARSSPARRRRASCTSSTTATCGCSRSRSSARTWRTTARRGAPTSSCRQARTHPILSKTYPLAEAGRAADDVSDNVHLGKVGVLCMAPETGLGVVDHALREQHLAAITRFQV